MKKLAAGKYRIKNWKPSSPGKVMLILDDGANILITKKDLTSKRVSLFRTDVGSDLEVDDKGNLMLVLHQCSADNLKFTLGITEHRAPVFGPFPEPL
ncbi:MAG: hypothetical protein Q8P20_04605 [bacterium]|nr:hypothetical protein [bacterium]